MPEIVVGRPGERLKELTGRRRSLVALGVVLACVVALSLAVFAMNRPATVAPPATTAEAAPPPPIGSPVAGAASPPLTSGAQPGSILVHVDGAVRRPGLYSLPQGARVADGVEAAGGPKRQADLTAVNLAEVLVDGQKVEIPKKGDATPEAPLPVSSPAPSAGASPTATVNVNTADQATLETLPEVGPVTAAAIIEYRDRSGPFSSVDQLLEVSGIGPATLEAMRPFVTV